jgi:anti-sigma factor RsiW
MSAGSQHPTEEVLHRYRTLDLPPEELAAVDTHVKTCEQCRGRVIDPQGLTAPMSPTRLGERAEAGDGSQHLSGERIAAYIDRKLDKKDRRRVEDHLKSCTECAAEAEMVRSIRALRVSPGSQKPAAVPASHERPAGGPGVPLLRYGLLAAGLGAAAAAAFVFGAVVNPQRQARPNQTAQPDVVARLETEKRRLESLNEDLTGQKQELEGQLCAMPELQTRLAKLEEETGTLAKQKHDLLRDYQTLQRSRPAQVIRTRTVRVERVVTKAHRPAFALKDGGKQVIAGLKGEALRPLPPMIQAAVKGKIPRPALLATLAAPPVPAGGVKLQVPVGVVVRTDQPAFSWRPVDGATSYMISIFDAASGQTEPVSQIETTTAHIGPVSLARGRTYRWRVMPLKDGLDMGEKMAREARFAVLGGEEYRKVEAARLLFGDSPLTLGVIYASAALLDEAEGEMRKLLNANPRSALAQKLLRNIRSLRRPQPQTAGRKPPAPVGRRPHRRRLLTTG